MARPITFATCHPERRTCARGLCKPCYYRDWHAARPGYAADVTRRYRQANRERVRASKRAWAAANPDAMRAMKRRDYLRHKDRRAAASRAWRLANPEKARDAVRRWTTRHPDAQRDMQRKVRAHRKDAPRIESVSRLAVLEANDGVCAICGRDVDPTRFHVDHILPLSAGGWHGYDNVQLAHPFCNISKGGT